MMGFEEAITPRLVDLQAAVEAVHAKWFDGEAAEAGAVLMTGAGASADPGPIGMQIIEAACSGGHRAELFVQWWSSDYSAWKGDPSDGDWFGANEAAYQLIQLGLDSPNAAADLEQTLRSGPWREKWDSPRPGKDDDGNPIRTTILGWLIGKALKRQRKRFESIGRIQFRQAGSDAADEEASPAPPADETRDQEVMRLRRELAQEQRAHAQTRRVNAVQQTVIRAERAAKETFRAKLAEIRDLMAIPSKRLSYAAKCLAVVLDNVFEATASYRADPDNSKFVQVRYGDLAAKVGGSEATVAREMNKTLCTDVGHPAINAAAPIVKHTRFVEREINGERRPTSETTIALKSETSMLSATLRYQPDEERKHGGARVQGCPKPACAGADLVIRSTTHCAKCGDQIGPARETLRHQVDVLGAETGAPVDVRYSGHQVDVLGGHDGEEQAEQGARVIPIGARADRLRRQDARVGRLQFRQRDHHADVQVSEEAERRDIDLTGHCPKCRTYTVKRRRSGVWTCAKCEAVLLVEPWAEAPKLVPPGCTRSGCREPAANGFVCAGHLQGDPLPAAIAGAEE